MPLADEIAALRQSLLELASRLGIDEALLRQREGVAVLDAFETVYEPPPLDAIQQADLDRWFGRFGRALTLVFEVKSETGASQGLRRELTAERHDQADLEAIAREMEAYNQPAEATLQIRKRGRDGLGARLAAALGAQDDLRVDLFFFAEALQRTLREPGMNALAFEQEFLADPDRGAPCRRLLVLVADADGQLRGPFLSFLGLDQLARAEPFARLPGQLRNQKLERAHALMNERCNWIGERPAVLTPDFFRLSLSGPAGGLEPCRGALIRLQNELSLPFLADRTTGAPGQWTTLFAGRSRAVTLTVGAEEESQVPYRLYRWVYSDPGGAETRLDIVRSVLSARLPAAGGFESLVRTGPELLSECAIQLQVLIDQNLTESFERRERIDKLVRDYVDETRKQMASLTRDLVGEAYKTAGLLLAVVIAYLLKPDQGPAVLVLSTCFYVLYLLFVRFFYLPTLGREHAARRQGFAKRKEEMRKSGLLTGAADQALETVKEEDDLLTVRRTAVERAYVLLALVPAVLVLLWLARGGWSATPQGIRQRALAEQARRFDALGYANIRRDVPQDNRPVPLTDARGRTAYPDLTALKKDSALIAVAWVPCQRIGHPGEAKRLRLLHELARERTAELQLLTEPVCAEEPGPRRLRNWLRGQGLPDLEIWTG